MGKKTKIGKQRKDKYYQLAKESGFRSRAAFKLIQLNRKFEFLQKSRVCIDLCAAPGGWMQVAKQNMPVSSIVIGVDLYPIKTVPGCISLTEDITTEKCRVSLSKELQTWKADVVLNDGAPNVGRNWLFDAYQQACLTLSALKLATQFLKQGGWFVTKVFRSKDYHPLVWVLKQFFKKVHATKPQASRNESAEIFVVCQYYIAPAKIDAKFLDPKHVFSELEIEPANKLNIFHPEKIKKQAEGYPENDYTLYHKLPASVFIQHEAGIELLQNASEIVFDDVKVENHEKTTTEIKECCKDIKVLGRKDLRLLLNWWKVLHEEYMKEKQDETKSKDRPGDDEDKAKLEDDNGVEDEEQIDQKITEVEEEELREQKRKKKKVQKERKKLNERLNLKMVLKGDEGPTLQSEDLFSLQLIKNKADMNLIIDAEPDIAPEEEEEPNTAAIKFQKYAKDQGCLDSSGMYYKDSDSELEMESDYEEEAIKEGLGFSDEEQEDGKTTNRQKKLKEKPRKASRTSAHPLITDLDYRNKEEKRASKARLFFERDIFKNLIDEKDEDADLDKLIEECKRKGAKVVGEESTFTELSKPKNNKHAPQESAGCDYGSEMGPKRMGCDSDMDTDSNSDSHSDYNIERSAPEKASKAMKRDGFEVVKSNVKKRKMTVEDLALGAVMINSKKSKRDLVDAAWNRYAFNDTSLPDWFVEDEKKHMHVEAPVPKELVDDYKKRMEELNVRPIKKVIEAKARKKRRAMKKLEKAKKRIEALVDNADVTDREKSKQIQQLYKKARADPKKEVTYVVAKKHQAGRRMARPVGVKGHYKVVDPRLKKDKRNEKQRAKKSKNKSGKSKGRPMNKAKDKRKGRSH